MEIVVPKKDNFWCGFKHNFVGMWAYISLGDEYDLGQMLFMHIAQNAENIIFHKIKQPAAGMFFFVCENVRMFGGI